MILIDTSSWIHALRPSGDSDIRQRVVALLTSGTACWCPIVRLELWNTASGDRDKKSLREFERVIPELSMTSDVWQAAYELARQARAAGISVPATDVLIAACARVHEAGLEHCDADFDRLMSL